jgi:hypothetical protein
MKKILFLLFVVQIIACSKAVEEKTPSECIQTKIDQFKTAPKLEGFSGITQYEYESKPYFYFDYGTAADWPAYLLDNQCDTICQLGFKMQQKPCKIADFFDKATVIGKIGE